MARAGPHPDTVMKLSRHDVFLAPHPGTDGAAYWTLHTLRDSGRTVHTLQAGGAFTLTSDDERYCASVARRLVEEPGAAVAIATGWHYCHC